MITYMQKVDTENGLDEAASVLASSFTKQSSASSARILHYDNLRVIGVLFVRLFYSKIVILDFILFLNKVECQSYIHLTTLLIGCYR